MFKKFISLALIIFLLLTSSISCSNKTLLLDDKQELGNDKEKNNNEQKNDSEQKSDNVKQEERFDLKSVEKYLTEIGRYDLRGKDLSDLTAFDITVLNNFLLDTQTKFPNSFSENFEKIVNFGKDPGLGIKDLHNDGITGKGVNIAIIDGVLLKEHNEIKDRIVYYEDLVDNEKVHYHGTLVTSVLCGKESGIATESNIYYVSYINDELQTEEKNEERYISLAKSIERVIEINKELPKGEKIRVLSISSGWDPNHDKAVEINTAINKAKEDGIFVVTARLYEHDKLYFDGVRRDVLSDPNNIKSFYNKNYSEVFNDAKEILLTPMDARWMASHIGVDDYTMYSRGAWSLVIPYISGVYALACQVYPEITPSLFWEMAISTGNDLKVYNNSFEGKTLKLINPVKLIEELKN